jgi:uncharacterized damage-inducible protein DinB
MDLLDRLTGHDVWATHQLLEIAQQLPDGGLDRDFDIGHRTVRRTFEHLIWNVECWTDLVCRRDVRERPANADSLEKLSHRYGAASAEFVQVARKIVDGEQCDELFLDRCDDPPMEKSLGGVIIHIATHGMHHRAHLLIIFRLLGMTSLPEYDALTWEGTLE